MTGSRRAVRDLARAALNPDGPGTVGDLVGVIARATGSHGGVLWEAPDEGRGDPTLSVLALWFDERWLDERVRPDTGRGVGADPITELAHRTRSLAVAGDVGRVTGEVYGHAVTAALPVDYTDGRRGVLTLLADGELSAAAFDAAVDLLDILPELCSAVRERQTLALVNGCNTILHDADVVSAEWPLSRERLGKHLSEVCSLVAAELCCTEVSIFLQEPGDRAGEHRLLASSDCSGAADPRAGPGQQVDVVRSGAGVGGEPFMEARLLSGERVSGRLRCRGTNGPPHHFTSSDLALLRPIAAQVSSYWRSWQNRWAVCEENESWRRLAAGMTEFNGLLAEGLGLRDGAHEQRMSEVAVRIVRDVVSGSAGSTILRATDATERAPTLVPVAATGDRYRSVPVPVSGAAAGALRTREQRSITDPRELLAEGVDAGSNWLLCTPIRFGAQIYGVLEAAGPALQPPDSAEQVHGIIADQMGLYRHLEHALSDLCDTQRRLEIAHRSEADAMEDLKHQLVSPLRTAADRTERVLHGGRFDGRVEGQLRAIRGLCRKAGRVAMSAGVFATLSRGEAPRPKPERIGIDDLLRLLIAAADDAQVLGNPRRGIVFDVERESVRKLGRRLVAVDTSFFQQCVGNLLDNAAKYAYEGTRVGIAAEVTAAQLVVGVTSIGLPMAKRDVARCLERNWRGDAARSTTGEGSGLGLWIVDNLMRSMRGRVVVEAVSDHTTVRLALPLT